MPWHLYYRLLYTRQLALREEMHLYYRLLYTRQLVGVVTAHLDNVADGGGEALSHCHVPVTQSMQQG